MSPELAKMIIEFLFSSALIGLVTFIYDYQTIIAGAGAIGAAYIAARPVYSQLGLLRTQSNGVHREMLLQRQHEIVQAHAALDENVSEKLRQLSGQFYWDDSDGGNDFTEQMAHHYDGSVSAATYWVRQSYHWRDNPTAEPLKEELLKNLDSLTSILQDIHYPAHHEQHGEDYSMSDEDYATFCKRGETAKSEVYPALKIAQTTLQKYQSCLKSEQAVLVSELKKLDQMLIAKK